MFGNVGVGVDEGVSIVALALVEQVFNIYTFGGQQSRHLSDHAFCLCICFEGAL